MPKKVETSPVIEELAERTARTILQIEMKKKGWSYRDLAERLNIAGIEDNEANVRNKIGRGTFSASFLLMCLMLMNCHQVDLVWAVEEAEKLLSDRNS